MGLPETSSRQHLSEATLEQFSKPLKGQLRDFIVCRKAEDPTKALAGLPTNKGKLSEAVRGESNMIRVAFDMRNDELKLKALPAAQIAEAAASMRRNVALPIEITVSPICDISELKDKLTMGFLAAAKAAFDPCSASPAVSLADAPEIDWKHWKGRPIVCSSYCFHGYSSISSPGCEYLRSARIPFGDLQKQTCFLRRRLWSTLATYERTLWSPSMIAK